MSFAFVRTSDRGSCTPCSRTGVPTTTPGIAIGTRVFRRDRVGAVGHLAPVFTAPPEMHKQLIVLRSDLAV